MDKILARRSRLEALRENRKAESTPEQRVEEMKKFLFELNACGKNTFPTPLRVKKMRRNKLIEPICNFFD